MKINGMRWLVLGIIVLITIINYLDRGTLNYMWIANTKIDYTLLEASASMPSSGSAIFHQDLHQYTLYNQDGTTQNVDTAYILVHPNGQTNKVQYIKKGGIAIDLKLVDPNLPPAELAKQSKKLLSYITMFFMFAYGVSQLVSGKLYDKIGTRKGFFVSVVIWSLADMCTSFATGVSSLINCRMLLGLGEAGPWPGAVKSNAEWFPVKERALAQGLFGAGGSVGSILAPVIISMLYLAFGWKQTFLIVGSLGLIWLIPWFIINKATPAKHPWVSEEERNHILGGQTATATNTNDQAKSWGELLRLKNSYAIILGRFFLDPIWWMFVTWLPIYLGEVFKLDIKQIAFSAWVPYVGAAIGAISGGVFSGRLIKQGVAVNKARKRAIIIGACVILPAMIAAAFATTALVAVLLMAFILGGFQFAVVNIQTLPSDFHTGKTVGSLAGLGGAAAVMGTIVSMFAVPYITAGGNWLLFFAMGAIMVPLAVTCVFAFSKN